MAILAVVVVLHQGARASVYAGSTDSMTWSGETIPASSTQIAVLGIGAYSDSDWTDSLMSVYVDFGGSGFSTGDLSGLSTDSSASGVGIYRDDGWNDDVLDNSDTSLWTSGCSWSGDQAQLTFDEWTEIVPTWYSGNYEWFIVITTSSSISDGDEIDITLAAGNVAFSDSTTQPGSDVYTDTLTADTASPGDWSDFSPSGWVTDTQEPTVTVSVQDTGSGLAVGTAQYQYSTDGGSSWSAWTSASMSGYDGTTSIETITASAVPFDQDSEDQNMIRFEADDMAGNTGPSGVYTVKIDAYAPGDWADIDPSGWFVDSNLPTVTISVQDPGSGLKVGTARYQYSTDGGNTWSAWTSAPASGNDGTKLVESITASNVPFNQDSGTLNMIRFKLDDMLGHTGTSGDYTVKIDTASPGSWASFSPTGWYISSKTPMVTITVQDATSGLGVGTAQYQYSTDGGASWSAWAAATVTGSDGTTAVQTITASNVPFNQDSETQNQIRLRINDVAGNTATTGTYTIKVDATGPGSWTGITPSEWYNSSQTPTVTISVQDVTSGLKAGSAYYQYSTSGGTSWSAWIMASVTGNDGTTAVQTITASNVPFNQDSGTQDQIRFKMNDIAGNTGTSGAFVMAIDTTPPGGWIDLNPSGWFATSRTPSVAISVRDATSGLSAGTAQYQYSTDGGASWSVWTSATVAGTDIQWIVTENVPFNQDSATQNQVRFKISDIVGNLGASGVYVVKIDTASPGNWAGISPSGWQTASRTPTVTITVQDLTSGLKVGTALYQYSTNGGVSWNALTPAIVTGTDGTTAVQTITAANVPFNQDSASLNRIRFQIIDLAGNMGSSVEYIIKIDTSSPGGWAGLSPSGWFTQARTPTVTIQAGDITSGLRVGSAEYQYSTDGGATWSKWIAATVTGTDGTLTPQTLTASGVPFNQDSAGMNMIRFRTADMAGNTGTSPDFVVRIDASSPGDWAGLSPSGWSNRARILTVTIQAGDTASGLKVGSAQYQYSTDGGATWSKWIAATVTGTDGTLAPQTLTASSVPFNKDSAGMNMIRFRTADIAGNEGTSPDFVVRIDTSSPGNWAGLSPSGWSNKAVIPIITIQAGDATSGLKVDTAQYQYSTDGGATWSLWSPATAAGTDGALTPQAITAENVPFNRDSATLNKIKFRITDMAGNTGTSPDFVVRIDTVVPGGWEGLSPSGWYLLSRTPTVTIQVADSLSGLDIGSAAYQYSTDGGATWSALSPATFTGTDGTTTAHTITAANVPFNQDSAGMNKIRFRVLDLAGNIGTSADYVIKVDATPPSTSLQALPPYSSSRSIKLSFTWSDGGSGFVHAELWYSVDGRIYQQYTDNFDSSPILFQAPSDGHYGFYLRGLDATGNLEPAPPAPQATTTVDTSPPVPIFDIREGGDTEGASAHLSGSVEPGSRLQVNGRDVSVDASGQFSATVPLSEGANKITLTATDPAGNSFTVTNTVNRHPTPVSPWLVWALGIGVVLAIVLALVLVVRRNRAKD